MIKFSREIQILPKGNNVVRIYTDGSCDVKTGLGGFAYIIQFQNDRPEVRGSGGVRRTTNNRMEITAAIEALDKLPGNYTVELVTDSEYLGKGIIYWMEGWKRSGWKQKNYDLWIKIYNLCQIHDVYITCIRGHQGQEENEECDRMAGEERLKLNG